MIGSFIEKIGFDIARWDKTVAQQRDTIQEVYLPVGGEAQLAAGGLDKQKVSVDFGCGSGVFARILLNTFSKNHIIFGVDTNPLAILMLTSKLSGHFGGQIEAGKDAVERALRTNVAENSKAFLVNADSIEFADCLPENSIDAAFLILPGGMYSAKIPGLNGFGNRFIEEVIMMKGISLLFCKAMKALKPGSRLVSVFGIRAADIKEHMKGVYNDWKIYGVLRIPYEHRFAVDSTEHVVEHIESATKTDYHGNEKQFIMGFTLLKNDNTGCRKVNIELVKALEIEWGNIQAGIGRNIVRAFPKDGKVEIGRFKIEIPESCFAQE